MPTVMRKKLEIIVEAPVLRRLEQILSEEGVRGWSVFRSVEGSGQGGEWRSDFTSAHDKRLVFAVTSEETAERVLARILPFLEDYPGVVCVSDVGVLRPERF
jgi:nitrogen regulatory protein PII